MDSMTSIFFTGTYHKKNTLLAECIFVVSLFRSNVKKSIFSKEGRVPHSTKAFVTQLILLLEKIISSTRV